jgi:aspartyl/glutamyl-tRNA(Asn/Gln) amidotransferase C subunit
MSDAPKVDVTALAKLAKLEVSAEELARLEKEIPEILGFVETIQQVSGDALAESPAHRNVMRDDIDPHEGGRYSKDLLDAAPAQKDDQIAVKQVISKK